MGRKKMDDSAKKIQIAIYVLKADVDMVGRDHLRDELLKKSTAIIKKKKNLSAVL